LRCIELEKAVVEGAGGTGLAAILQGIIPGLEGKK
jgi:threonine dehydratase